MISFVEQFGEIQQIKPPEPYVWFSLLDFEKPVEGNPLAAMCNYKDTHSTEIHEKPSYEVKPAIDGILACTNFDWRLGAWK